MPKLPRITGEDACKAFAKAGFECCRIRGSHRILKHATNRNRLSIPVHKGKTLGAGLLLDKVKAADLTVEQFIELLKS
jgi:predicted RNA binding protein YcfA (HicA-like mRNA interferase family)